MVVVLNRIMTIFFLKFNVQAVAASPFNLAYVRAALIDFIFKSNDVHVLYVYSVYDVFACCSTNRICLHHQ